MTHTAYLFDLDGTLVDSDHLHFEAFRDLFAEFGVALDYEGYERRVLGRPNAAIMADLLPGLEARHAELADRKEAAFRRMATSLAPKRGLAAFLAQAEEAGIAIAVVTNAPRLNALHMLRAIGLERLAPSLVIGEELARAKPDPLPYLTALGRLGVEAGRALAFEDSPSGIRSATGAGLRTVALRSAIPEAVLIEAGASIVVEDFADEALRSITTIASPA